LSDYWAQPEFVIFSINGLAPLNQFSLDLGGLFSGPRRRDYFFQ
jgi:hypothetical protein